MTEDRIVWVLCYRCGHAMRLDRDDPVFDGERYWCRECRDEDNP